MILQISNAQRQKACRKTEKKIKSCKFYILAETKMKCVYIFGKYDLLFPQIPRLNLSLA